MSSFGQYVHYQWANYKLAGTYQSELGWRDQKSDAVRKQPRNFNSSLFTSHRESLLNYLYKNYSTPNLKSLEKKYNDNNLAMLKRIQDLQKNKGSSTEELKILLKLVVKKWSDLDIEKIIADLKVNDQGMLYYSGSGFEQSSIKSNLKFFFDIQEGHSIYIAPLQKRCVKFKELIESDDSFDNESKAYYVTKLKRVMHALDLLSQHQKISDDILDATVNKNHQATTKTATAHGKISNLTDATVKQYILDPLKELASLFNSKAYINKVLTYRLPEILGELIAAQANNIAVDTANKEMQKTIKTLLQQVSITGGQGQTMTTQVDYYPQEFSNFNKSVLEGTAKEVIKSEDGTEEIRFRKVGGPVQQKTDIIVDGVHNASLKTTDMSKVEFTKAQFTTPKIALQNSSLYLFLLGIQRSEEDLGTHYLNILSKHPDTDALYQKMRNQANRALSLYILYSSLTGEGQLRKGKYAHIFAIYDTSVKGKAPRVRFYDMWDILNKVDMFKTGAIFSPSVESIYLENDLVDSKNGYSRSAANIRISKLLVEARNKNISTSLSKQFLNAVYK